MSWGLMYGGTVVSFDFKLRWLTFMSSWAIFFNCRIFFPLELYRDSSIVDFQAHFKKKKFLAFSSTKIWGHIQNRIALNWCFWLHAFSGLTTNANLELFWNIFFFFECSMSNVADPGDLPSGCLQNCAFSVISGIISLSPAVNPTSRLLGTRACLLPWRSIETLNSLPLSLLLNHMFLKKKEQFNILSITSFGVPCCSAAQSCLTLCDPMDGSTPGFPVHHHLPELAQVHVHWIGDAIQPSHHLSPPPLVLSLHQHQGLFQWVGCPHQVAKALELQL